MSDTKATPDGYHSLQAYAMFKDCDKAIDFYKNAFGAKEKVRSRRNDGSIQHAELQIGDSVLMLADEYKPLNVLSVQHYGGSPVSFYIYVEDCDETYQQAMAAGAQSISAPSDQPYGDRNGGIIDPFGYKWWIGSPIAKSS